MLNEIMGQAQELVRLVDYQAGAIVSKEVLKKKTGTLTLFAFDAGQGLSEHTAPFDAFVYVFDGMGEITLAGKTHVLKAGQSIIMPANQPHSVKAAQKFKMLLALLKD